MTTNPGHEENEPQPENARPFIGEPADFIKDEESATPPESQAQPVEENEPSVMDPLNELRQDLFEEEQPSSTAPTTSLKNGIFQRVTGNLASRRVPTQPNEQTGFGVRTAGQPPFTPLLKNDSSDEDVDAGENEIGQNPQPFRPTWPRPKYFEEEEEDEVIEMPGPQDTARPEENHPDSKVMSPSKVSAPIWNGDPYDAVVADVAPTVPAKEPKPARKSEERRQLPSGFERQKQVSPYISYNPKRSLGEQIQEMGGIEKFLIAILVVAIVIVIALVGYLYLTRHNPGFISGPPIATPTATEIQKTPMPVSLRLTGGWDFPLSMGVMVDGQWNPVTSEWLDGWEIRRVVAIPWNKQVQAVVQTFEPGDPIELQMNNGDVLEYKVVSVSEVAVNDTSIMYDTKASLAIILNQPNAEKRWVVIAEP